MAKLISAGPFATDGERRAAAKLKQLPDEWIVVCNKVLPTKDGRSYEIDFIVMGTRWIFIIDEKSWTGKIIATDQEWVREDGFVERSPLSKAYRVAQVVAGHVRDSLGSSKTLQGIITRGGVLLSLATDLPDIRDSRAAEGVFLFESVCERLQEIDRRGGNPNVAQFRDRIRDALVGLAHRPEVPSTIGLYTVEEATHGRTGGRILQARFQGTEPRILLMYELGHDPLAIREQRALYMREFEALRELRASGLVPEVGDAMEWGDNSLIIPIVPPTGDPLASYPLPQTINEFGDELLLAAACFRGLDQIHEKAILHRGIGPDAIYVAAGGRNPKPIFTNFHSARLGTETIAVSLNALPIDDEYRAPELRSGFGMAMPESDTFSLALVFLARLARAPIVELEYSQDGDVLVPDLQSYISYSPAAITSSLTELYRAVLVHTPSARKPAREVADRLAELAADLRSEGRGEDELLGGRYRITRVLGEGAMARTLLAKDSFVGDIYALKQFRHPSDVPLQAIAEFRALQQFQSSYLPRVYDVYPSEEPFHVKMEYIPGPTLADVVAEFPWRMERWWAFARDLLGAVETLESRNLLHRDIKPDNIILRESDGRPVLIDFGFATREGVSVQIAGTPLYLPPEAARSTRPPITSDRYAAAVVLFRALTGEWPFDLLDNEHTPLLPVTVIQKQLRTVAEALLKALATDPAQRPASVSKLRELLQAAMQVGNEPDAPEELRDETNEWVNEIRGLYRNSEIGNADNRGLDSEFARQTYVPTALDERLLPLVFEHHPHAVFLSGNPGDGKTAFLERFQQELERRGAIRTRKDHSGWEWQLEGHIYRSCYDASESNGNQTADEQLTQKLADLEGNDKPKRQLTVLVAINDGRLVDYFARNRNEFRWLDRQINRALQGSKPEVSDVWLVDLKRRTFVGLADTVSRSTFRRVLEQLVKPVGWEICKGCAAQTVCPMRNNALMLRDSATAERLEHLLLLTHLRRQRHTTMRDLRSGLAYIITGDSACRDVHATRHGEESATPLVDLRYWRSVFNPVKRGDELLDDLAVLDPARFPAPRLDRFLHFHSSENEAAERSVLYRNTTDLAPELYSHERDWIDAVKRRLYFEAPERMEKRTGLEPELWQQLLPYRYATEYLDVLMGSADLGSVRERLAMGILRSDNVAVEPLHARLSIKVQASEEQQLVVLKSFPLEQFAVSVSRPLRGGMVEVIPEVAVLEHESGTPRLEITLDLFELLMHMADGLQPTAPELQPLLEDLAAFKSTLLLRETRDLVLVESGRWVHHVTQQNGKIVRETAVREVRV